MSMDRDARLLRQLTQEDRKLLVTIYEHRCVNTDLAWRYCYRQAGYPPSQVRDRLLKLSRPLDLLRPVPYEDRTAARKFRSGPDTAWFLTRRGMGVLRLITGMNPRGSRGERQEGTCTARRPSELLIGGWGIPHQMGLNRFVLAFKAGAGGRSYVYYDRLYMPPCCESMKPDGILVYGDTVILLEQDMGTERGVNLEAKWLNYRTFLQHPTPFYQGRKLVLLFLLDRVSRIDQRRSTLWNHLNSTLLDRINGSFEAYADRPATILQLLLHRLIPEPGSPVTWPALLEEKAMLDLLEQRHGFTLQQPQVRDLLDVEYRALLQRPAGEGPSEFFFDCWLDGELSVLHKICNHNRLSAALALSPRAGRHIPYLVAVRDPEWIVNVVTRAALTDGDLARISFVTPERLRTLPLHEAIFQVDSGRGVYHFRDDTLRERVPERRFPERKRPRKGDRI